MSDFCPLSAFLSFRGTLPTQPAFVPLFHSLSLQSTALKRRDTISCLPWMSFWPCTSACPWLSVGERRPLTCPNCVRLLQLSLDAPTLQLDRRLRHFISMLVLQVFQAKILTSSDKFGLDPATLRALPDRLITLITQVIRRVRVSLPPFGQTSHGYQS